MKTETIVMCVVALILGMLMANMLKSVCGCKIVEGQRHHRHHSGGQTAVAVAPPPPPPPLYVSHPVATYPRGAPPYGTRTGGRHRGEN